MAERGSQSTKSVSKKEFDFLLSPVRSCQSENGQPRTGWTQEHCRNFLNSARPVFSGLLERILDKSYERGVTAELRRLLVQLNADFEEKIGGVFTSQLQRAVGLRDEVISDLEKQLHTADKSVLNRVEVVESHYMPLLMEKRKEIECEKNRANSLDVQLQEIVEKLNQSQQNLALAERHIDVLQKKCLSKGEKMLTLKGQVKRHCVAIEKLRADRKRDAEQYLNKITYLNRELEMVASQKDLTSGQESQSLTPRRFDIVMPPDSITSETTVPAAKDLRCAVFESQIARELDSLSRLIVAKFMKVEQAMGSCSRDTKRLEELVKSSQSLAQNGKPSSELSRPCSLTRVLQLVSGTICCLALGAMFPVCMQVLSDRSNRLELS